MSERNSRYYFISREENRNTDKYKNKIKCHEKKNQVHCNADESRLSAIVLILEYHNFLMNIYKA